MAGRIKFRGGTTAEHSVFTGSDREITVDTTKKTLVLHDGVLAGGYEMATQSNVDLKADKSDTYTKAQVDTKVSQVDAKVDTEKGRIDAILSASEVDKDSFKEIVDLINSVDTTNDNAFAGYVLSNNAAVALKAPLDSPAFTGNPVLPTDTTGVTQAAGDNSTKLATTAFVNAEIANDAITKDSVTGVAFMPSGTTAQRPTLLSTDKAIRFNTDLQSWESWNGNIWGSLGGGQMLGSAANKAISYNSQSIAENIVVPAGVNAYSVGDVTLENGYTITVENGSVYKIL